MPWLEITSIDFDMQINFAQSVDGFQLLTPNRDTPLRRIIDGKTIAWGACRESTPVSLNVIRHAGNTVVNIRAVLG